MHIFRKLTDEPPSWRPHYHDLFLQKKPKDIKNIQQNIMIPPGQHPDPKMQGHHDAIKEDIKEGDKFKQKLDQLVITSQQTLLNIKAVWPFDFFPNEVCIDVNKVSIIQRGFLAERRHSVFIKDISDVFIDTSIFFSSLNIVDIGFTENLIQINYLKKDDAKLARRIIQGLIVATKKDIELSKMNKEDLLKQVEELGKIQQDEKS